MIDNLTGKMKIYKRVLEEGKDDGKIVYSTILASTKDQDGNFTNFYVDVTFRKGIELKADVSQIEMSKGWLKTYVGKDNVKRLGLFVDSFKVLDSEMK